MAKVIMVQGTMSNAGKSLLAAGLCRIFAQDGYKVAPFKSQNMALNSFITEEGLEMGRAQVMQAEAAGIKPSVYMNPILLKPTNDVGSQVIVNGEVLGTMSARDYFRYKKKLVPDILKAFHKLSEEYDIIVIEGAGSPAEINLKSEDIVNMGMAKMAHAPVLLVGDIDRGGVFAQLVGTVELLEKEERARIKGLIINKFRGDKSILDPGIEMLEERVGIPVVGVTPYLHIEVEDEDSLMARREEYPAELPEGVLVLTAGVDTQDDRMEYEIVGHGHFGETWGIEKGIIMGRPDDDAVWAQLDELVFDRVLRFENGVGLKMSMSFVDEGGHFTQEVRMQCRARLGKKVFCIKGMPGSDKPYTAPPKKQKIIIKQTAVGTCWQYQIGVDSGKEVIMDNLRVQTPGAKYCHFPKRDDYGSGYFTGLLSEVKVYDPNKKQPWQWKKIPGHERNEALDCRNYALAAFKALPKNLDEIDRRLKEAGGERAPSPVATPVMPPPAAKQRPKRRSGKKYYDDW